MRVVPTILCTLTLLLSSISAQEDDGFRTFTSTDGNTVEARLLKVTGDSVIIQNRARRNFTLPIARLSPDDQKFVADQQEQMAKTYVPNLEVRYQSGKSDKLDRGGDFDDRLQYIEPNVFITNRDLDFTLEDAEATLVVVGEQVVDRKEMKVLYKDDFTFSLTPGQTWQYSGRRVRNDYDDKNTVRYGYKYDGYVVVISNAAGKVIAVKGVGKYDDEDMVEKLLAATEGQILR